MKELDNVENYGIYNKHTLMDNGELRFRLISNNDNTSYIRTESKLGGLQNSHYHKNFKEMYIVQKGKIIIYEYINNKVKETILNEGDYFVTEVNIPHNVYMYPETVIHTVKFGNSTDNDWYPFEELDKLLK